MILNHLFNLLNLLCPIKKVGFLWTVKYEANELPENATPAWTKSGNATTIEILPAGYLHVDSSTAQLRYSITNTNLSNAVGTTLEINFKLIAGYDQSSWAGYPEFCIHDGTRQLLIYIATDQVYAGDGGENEIYNMNTTDDHHTYCITLKDDVYKVYIDGVLRCFNLSWTSPSDEHHVNFHPEVVGKTGVETSWDYVYYRTDGAFAP